MSSIDTKELSAHLDDMKGTVDSFVQAQHAELAKLDAEAQAARAHASGTLRRKGCDCVLVWLTPSLEQKHGLQQDLASAGVSAAAASKGMRPSAQANRTGVIVNSARGDPKPRKVCRSRSQRCTGPG